MLNHYLPAAKQPKPLSSPGTLLYDLAWGIKARLKKSLFRNWFYERLHLFLVARRGVKGVEELIVARALALISKVGYGELLNTRHELRFSVQINASARMFVLKPYASRWPHMTVEFTFTAGDSLETYQFSINYNNCEGPVINGFSKISSQKGSLPQSYVVASTDEEKIKYYNYFLLEDLSPQNISIVKSTMSKSNPGSLCSLSSTRFL